jgi:gpW
MPMALTDAQQQRLAALTAARDKLIMGQAVAELDYAGGERTVFTKADLNRLDREIALLTQGGYGNVRVRL